MVIAAGAQDQRPADHDFASVKTLSGATVGYAQLIRTDNGSLEHASSAEAQVSTLVEHLS
jgi:hypothetical protein